MLYAFWRWIQLWLPYGLILWMYKSNKAIPANIRTRQGRNLTAVMVTTDYGVIYSKEHYIENRAQKLKQKQKEISQYNDALIREINNLSFQERERLYNREEDGTI